LTAIKIIVDGNTHIYSDQRCEKIYLCLGCHPSKEGCLIQVSARLSDQTRIWPDLELSGNERVSFSFYDPSVLTSKGDINKNSAFFVDEEMEHEGPVPDVNVTSQEPMLFAGLKVCFQGEEVIEAEGVAQYFVSLILTGTKNVRNCSVSVCDQDSLISDTGFSIVWRKKLGFGEEISVSF